jgi:hypothetical protein
VRLFLLLFLLSTAGAQSLQRPDRLPSAHPAADASPFKIEAHEPAILRDGNGAQRLRLTNNGATAVPLDLTVGAFYDDTARTKIESPKVAFSLDSGGPLPASLAPQSSIEVIVDFHGFSGSLSAHARLFNQGQPVIRLRLVAVDIPVNITLDGPGTSDQPLTFSYNRSAIITLRNGGKDYVRLHWRFMIGGTVECAERHTDQKPSANAANSPNPARAPDSAPASSQAADDSSDADKVDCSNLVIPPGGLSRLIVKPSSDVFAMVDSLRPRTLTGKLLLKPAADTDVDSSLFDIQPIPVTLTMYRWSPEGTQVLFALYVMVLLFIGGALSLMASAILPDIQKKLAYQKTVGALADRTSTISNRVNSFLRVLVRLERNKIERALRDVHWYSLSTGEKIDAIAADTDKLDKRLKVVETLDDLRRKFEAASASAPPSASDLIDQSLDSAASQLRAVDLSDDDVAAANVLLAKAILDLDALQDGDLQTKKVADNFKQIKSRLQAFPPEYYADLKAALPGIFRVFDQPFDDTQKLVPTMLFAIDHAITAGHIALDYAIVRASIARGGTQACAQPGEQALQRLLARECRLLELLGTFSWKALRSANLLVQQMREDIYESDVLDEARKHRDEQDRIVRIAYDTMRVRPYLPIFFSLAFDNPRFANAAALRCVVFRWQFPNQLFEDTATVCHFLTGDEPGLPRKTQDTPPSAAAPTQLPTLPPLQLPNKDELKIRKGSGFTTLVSLEIHSAESPADCAVISERVKVDPPPRWSYTRNGVEFARFLLAFGVALVVLEAGIMDQLKKLDLLAATVTVIALGFGADSIKNLLSQSPKSAPATAPKPIPPPKPKAAQ